jgi:hypothetical protein
MADDQPLSLKMNPLSHAIKHEANVGRAFWLSFGDHTVDFTIPYRPLLDR